MRVLIVDTNRVFARQICRVLRQHGRGIETDMVDNVHVLRDRLKSNEYDLIIADVMTALNPDDLAAELDKLCTLKLVWSVTPTFAELKHRLAGALSRILPKPVSTEELEKVLEPVLASVVDYKGNTEALSREDDGGGAVAGRVWMGVDGVARVSPAPGPSVR